MSDKMSDMEEEADEILQLIAEYGGLPGTEGQDRESYTDDQDRENYTPDEEE